MNFKNNKSGITLVALIVTIIVLLILAGISISALTQTELFEKAKQAKDKSESAIETENIILGDYENKIDKITKSSRDSKNLSVEHVTNTKLNTEYIDTKKSTLTVQKYGNIITISGRLTLSQTNGNGNFLYIENLPRSMAEIFFVATDENAQKINMRIDTDGKLYNYWSGCTIYSGKEIRLSMTYICK